MKVYVITCGEYSDYQIYAVTLDKEQAELLKAKYSDEFDAACIEEYDTDNDKIEVGSDYKPMWFIEFNGSIICKCYTITHQNHKHGMIKEDVWNGHIKVFVEAKDKEHAKKIATDTYMKWLAGQSYL